MVIYKITNLINDNCYIGSTVRFNKRKQKHFRLLNENKHANKHLQNAFNLYGGDNFIFDIIEYCDKSGLISREQFWIDAYRSSGASLYNLRLIAQSNYGMKFPNRTSPMKGRHFTEEHKRKLSESGKGKHNTLKGRRSPMKGKHLSEETKKKLSELMKGKNTWMKGRTFSEETRKKMSEAKRKKGAK